MKTSLRFAKSPLLGTRNLVWIWGATSALFLLTSITFSEEEKTEGEAKKGRRAYKEKPDPANFPKSIEEARGRARWLHETIHGTLQIMHRDFFDDEFSREIPSKSMEDVFAQMNESWAVSIRWLGGNATKVAAHDPQDRFEEKAVQALIAGAQEYEDVERGRFRFVSAIRLQNQCLKCHVPHRTSLEDRVAGLAISIPLNLASTDSAEEEAEATR